MPLYKVTAEKPNGMAGVTSTLFNPFRIKDIFDLNLPRIQYKVREWEFEAKDEKAVREFWRDAQEQGLEAVQGFKLTKIEELKACVHTPDCVEDYCAKGLNPKCPYYKTV